MCYTETMEDKVDKLIERIKDFGLQKSLNQRELAEMTGVPESTLSRLFNGKRDLTWLQAKRIAKVPEFNLVSHQALDGD